jgi:hypothetical protein
MVWISVPKRSPVTGLTGNENPPVTVQWLMMTLLVLVVGVLETKSVNCAVA